MEPTNEEQESSGSRRKLLLFLVFIGSVVVLATSALILIRVLRSKSKGVRQGGRQSSSSPEDGSEEEVEEEAEPLLRAPVEPKNEAPASEEPENAATDPKPSKVASADSELPIAKITLPYLSPRTGKSLTALRDKLESDITDMFGEFERLDDEEQEEGGAVIEGESSWVFEIPMEDTPENRESFHALAAWLLDAAELNHLDVQYADGEEEQLKDDEDD